MPYLNLSTGVLIYIDPNVENPKIRLADITDTLSQIIVSNVKTIETVIQPGESNTVITTQRTVSGSINTSEFDITRPIATDNIARMTWNGVGANPGFRTLRSIGIDNTTHMAMTRVGPRSMKLMSISGTAFNTAAIQTGDQLWIERNSDSFTNVFSPYNTDKLLTIQSRGTGFIVVNDEGLLGEEADLSLGSLYDSAFKIFVKPATTSPKVGDFVTISANGFNTYNRGTFELLRITDDYIEFSNPYSVEESAVSGGMIIFDYMIRFAHMIASDELTLTFDGNNTGFVIEKLGDQAQFTSTLKTTQITATNNSLSPVSIRCQFSGAIV